MSFILKENKLFLTGQKLITIFGSTVFVVVGKIHIEILAIWLEGFVNRELYVVVEAKVKQKMQTVAIVQRNLPIISMFNYYLRT